MNTQKQVEEQILAAKNYADSMLAKANDLNQKFLNHEPMCKLCLGTGSRTIYKYGISYSKRCESATFDQQRKRWSCSGNPNWQELEKENKKDLSTEIWKIVTREKLKEPFMLFLKRDYAIEQLGNLFIQQLHTILCTLRSGKLISLLSSYNLSIQSQAQSQSQKAA